MMSPAPHVPSLGVLFLLCSVSGWAGPPYLDENTVVDSNATTGFAQAPRVSPREPNVELPVSAKDRQYFTFPHTANPSGTATQIRTMEGAQEDDVASCELAAQRAASQSGSS